MKQLLILRQSGSLAIEFALFFPFILAVVIFSFALAFSFITEALLHWNLHKISRQVSISQGTDFELIRQKVLRNYNFGLFNPSDVSIEIKACPSLKDWGLEKCTPGFAGRADWLVQYTLRYRGNLTALFRLSDSHRYQLSTTTLVRNEPDLPVKADLL